MSAPEPVNMPKSTFTGTTPHSARASSSISSDQAPIPASSSAAPGPSTPAQPTSPEPSNIRIPERLMHKNRLQEYAQKSNIPFPIYQTVNEGPAHAPKFRSTVCIDGKYYTSENVFSVRKAAEQDVAKLAFECIVTNIKDEGLPVILEKTMFFKSILNEYASKMNLDKVTYNTVKQEGHPFFVSSLVFNGKCYTGDPARNKKEAEQLAARAAILSNLGDSGSGTCLFEIIKSKFKFCAAFNNIKDSQHFSTVPSIASTGHTSVSAAHVPAQDILPECSSGVLSVEQGFQMSKPEKSPEDSKLLNLSLQVGAQQHIGDSSNLGKRKKNKNKANKKPRLNSLTYFHEGLMGSICFLDVSQYFSQAASCCIPSEPGPSSFGFISFEPQPGPSKFIDHS